VSVTLVRAPLRISFGGGGTDLPSYYRAHGDGFVVSAAIDRYVYVLVNTRFQERYLLKHLEWEEVDDPSEARHPILREALSRHWNGHPVELASTGDVPPGTGLGSSGAYTVATLGALAWAAGASAGAGELAERACELEIDLLQRTVGKQDQYAAAFGGVNALTFRADEAVDVRRLELAEETRAGLGERFLLFYTGAKRSASEVLSHQVSATLSGDAQIKDVLDLTRELAHESCAALEAGELDRLGELMNAQWEVKRRRAPGTATPQIEELRELALGSGALGALLMGAGGGGFLLVYAPDPERVRRGMGQAGVDELRFDVDWSGCIDLTPASRAGG
jgi:D-glycero-alpha-D-manno-heptose-7-phosphate kinase